MENTTKAFEQLINSIFTKYKIKQDFIFYLAESYEALNHYFIAPIYNQDTRTFTDEILSANDPITILSCKCVIDHGCNITYIVRIAVGEFKKHDNQPHHDQAGKCFATLRYSVFLHIYDADLLMYNK